MADFYSDIARIMTADPGGRGLIGGLPQTDLVSLTRSITSGSRFLILTGFPIPDCGVGETDGPPGAANLARALVMAHKRVTVVTDDYNLAPVRAAVELFAPGADVVSVPMEGAEDFCRRLRVRENPTHIIAIERPGGHDGHYYNMHGRLIDAYVAPTDSLFAGFGGVTIGIGDGGNELGMGSFSAQIARLVPNGAEIAADYGANFPLVAGVSNWWGWGIAALLSEAYKQDMLPSDAAETALLQAVIDAGAVDGMLHERALSVDGLGLEENLQVLRELRRAVLHRITR